MKIEVVDSIEKLLSYEAEWKSILKEINNDIMFLEPEWVINWWKFFGGRHRLFVLIIKDGEEVAGICPLMITKKGICNELDFIGSRESSGMDFIIKAEYRLEALECVCNFLRSMKGKNIIKFHGISEKSANYTALKEYFNASKGAFVSSNLVRYCLNMKNTDFNTLFENRFSKKTRETMNNKEKKLRRLGELVYKKISASEMDDVFEIHEKRWSRKIGNSSFSKGESKEFFKRLASDKNGAFNTTVDAITLNNKIISFMYGYEYKGKYLFIRIAHDDDFFFLSPGELVLKKKIEECFQGGTSVFDFGPGNDPYKAKWTDDYENISRITFPSDGLQAKLIFYAEYWTKIKLISALRKNKTIYNFRKYSLGKLKLFLSRAYVSKKAAMIKRNVGQIGLLPYLLKGINDLAARVFYYKKHLLLERNLSNLEISQSALQVREATINDLDALSQVMIDSPSGIIRRFVNKHKCFITLFEDRVIHYCWVNCSSIEIPSAALSMPLKKSEAHIYDVFLEKKYRNKQNYMYIFSHIFNLLYKGNYKRCYITLDGCSMTFENEIYRDIFQPSYKVLEKRIFSTIKHSVVDLKLSS